MPARGLAMPKRKLDGSARIASPTFDDDVCCCVSDDDDDDDASTVRVRVSLRPVLEV